MVKKKQYKRALRLSGLPFVVYAVGQYLPEVESDR
jgi:hypothetical protein